MTYKFYSKKDKDKSAIWTFSANNLEDAILIASKRKALTKKQFLELYKVDEVK
jgi:hypothetical protein